MLHCPSEPRLGESLSDRLSVSRNFLPSAILSPDLSAPPPSQTVKRTSKQDIGKFSQNHYGQVHFSPFEIKFRLHKIDCISVLGLNYHSVNCESGSNRQSPIQSTKLFYLTFLAIFYKNRSHICSGHKTVH